MNAKATHGAVSSSTEVLLQALALSRADDDGKQLLHSTDLSVGAGELIVCMGKSGAGKTVLLRGLAMLDRCEGNLVWRGNKLVADTVPRFRSQVMYVQQTSALPDGDVESALQQPFEWTTHRALRYQRDDVIKLLAQLGRDAELLAANTTNLSGGETQIVALVRALLLRPSVLLLDEPTSAMDNDAVEQAEALLTEWLSADPRRAIVYVTHQESQATRLATRRIWLEEGRVVRDV